MLHNEKKVVIGNLIFVIILLFFYYLNSKGIYFWVSEIPDGTIRMIVLFSIPSILILINSKSIRFKILSIVLSFLFILLFFNSSIRNLFVAEHTENKTYISTDNNITIIVQKYRYSIQEGIRIYKKKKFFYVEDRTYNLFVSTKEHLDISEPVGTLNWIDDYSFTVSFWYYDDIQCCYYLKNFVFYIKR